MIFTHISSTKRFSRNTSRRPLLLNRRWQGFSLTEILVAVLLLTIGFLGIAGLQTQGLRFSQDSYFRTQADLLVNDLVDRMRANRFVASQSAYVHSGSLSSLAGAAEGATPHERLASEDLQEWAQALQDSGLPGVGANVTCANCGTGENVNYTVQVFWLNERSDSNTTATCDNDTQNVCFSMTVML